MPVRISPNYGTPACSMTVNGPCRQPARELLLISEGAGFLTEHPRCAVHPAADSILIMRRVRPDLRWIVVPLLARPTAVTA